MLISEDIKLDYSDVLIRPKRSILTSRYDVDMTRTYKFVHSKKEWTGVPIMASNMDTVGTPEMYKVLSEHQIVTCPFGSIEFEVNDGENKWKVFNDSSVFNISESDMMSQKPYCLFYKRI